MSINQIVANALESFSDSMPQTAQAIIQEGWFVTRVILDDGSIPVKVNGIWQVPAPEYNDILDTQNKMTSDEAKFQEHSQNLYNLFNSFEGWYKC